jgi:hypothetical protein
VCPIATDVPPVAVELWPATKDAYPAVTSLLLFLPNAADAVPVALTE